MQVITLGGELLGNAESLLRDGLHVAEIADGYSKAAAKVRALCCRPQLVHEKTSQTLKTPRSFSMQALEVLESLVFDDSREVDVRSKEAVSKIPTCRWLWICAHAC